LLLEQMNKVTVMSIMLLLMIMTKVLQANFFK
jgi:hypothetical protein